MRHGLLEPFVLLASSLVATVVSACPDCATAQVVKASVLGEGFWGYLVMLAVPFLLIGALSALLYRIGLSPHDMTSARARNRPGRQS